MCIRDSTLPARTASWQFLKALDNILRICTERDLSAYKVDGYNHKDLQAKPELIPGLNLPLKWLSITSDQCAAQLSPLFFLSYQLGITSLQVFDPNHRVQNDLYAAVRSAGLWHLIKLKTIAWNMNYGPFQSGGHWSKVVDAGREFMKHASVSHPLFQCMLPKIARDRGETHLLGSDAYEQSIWTELEDIDKVLAKRSKMQVSRWGQWFRCFEEHRRYKSMRCLVLLFMAVESGWSLDGKKGITEVKRAVTHIEKGSNKREAAAVAAAAKDD
eukprot:2863248-Amphidinium_carterae.1